jgi:hypothetical protein
MKRKGEMSQNIETMTVNEIRGYLVSQFKEELKQKKIELKLLEKRLKDMEKE